MNMNNYDDEFDVAAFDAKWNAEHPDERDEEREEETEHTNRPVFEYRDDPHPLDAFSGEETFLPLARMTVDEEILNAMREHGTSIVPRLQRYVDEMRSISRDEING